jgi:hypothetical protein
LITEEIMNKKLDDMPDYVKDDVKRRGYMGGIEKGKREEGIGKEIRDV